MTGKNVAQRQRIGPQIRHLRQIRGLTLDDLAGDAGLSASHLSRLERSQTLPSFTVLANIAHVLGVSIDEFVKLEHDLQELDEQLAWQARLLGLDDNAYQEIVGLSIDTRKQLNRAIEVLSGGELTNIRVQEDTSRLFRDANSLKETWPSIRSKIESDGLNPVGLSRGLVQLHEIPGPRFGVITTPGLLTVSPNSDYEAVYRALFRSLPIDPAIAQHWNSWHKLAKDQFPFDWQIRVIVHRDIFKRIENRFAKDESVDGRELARNLARYWQQMLQDDSQLELAVTETDLATGNIMTAGGAAALFEEHLEAKNVVEQRAGVWVSSQDLVAPINATLNPTWDALPERDKDHNVVNDWIARHV